MKIIIFGYAIAALISAILGAIGYYRLLPWYSYFMYDASRVMAQFKDPNVFGPFFIPLIIWLLFSLVEPLNKKLEASKVVFRDIFNSKKYKQFVPILWSEFTQKMQLLRIFSIVLFYWAVVFSGSRGAWINFFVAMICFVLFYLFSQYTESLSRIGLLAFLIIIMIPITVLFIYSSHNYLQSRSGIKEYDTVRFSKQAESIKISISNPVGIGPG